MVARAGDVLVGRAHELAELERALAATRAGAGGTVLIAGDVGIGKTRVVADVRRRARELTFEVLLGRCIDVVGRQLAYQPFIEALRPRSAWPSRHPGNSRCEAGKEDVATFEELTLAASVVFTGLWSGLLWRGWEAGRRRYFALNWIQASARWTAFGLFLTALILL